MHVINKKIAKKRWSYTKNTAIYSVIRLHKVTYFECTICIFKHL